MTGKIVTIKEATEKWVREFRPFPDTMIRALIDASLNNKEKINEEKDNKKKKQMMDNLYLDTWMEITPPRTPEVGDRVHIERYIDYDNDETMFDLDGEIIGYNEEEDQFEIKTDFHDKILLDKDEFEDTEHEPTCSYCEDCVCLPMYGTLWQFGDPLDDDEEYGWLKHGGGLQIMADLGFRIYESEEFGCFFGIDGTSNFYEDYWIPLYKARGLKYHTEGVVE